MRQEIASANQIERLTGSQIFVCRRGRKGIGNRPDQYVIFPAVNDISAQIFHVVSNGFGESIRMWIALAIRKQIADAARTPFLSDDR